MNEVDIKTSGIARQTNPTAVLNGQRVEPTYDDVGRQLTRPLQVRDLIYTATVSLTNGTKTELRAGVTGAFLDLVQISCANDSSAATTVTVSDESTTVRTLPVPANSVTHVSYPIPLKQSATNVAWYVDLPDITGTTITVEAEFIAEV